MSTIEEARKRGIVAVRTAEMRLSVRRASTPMELDLDVIVLRDVYRALRALLDATEPPVIQYADSATVAGLAEKIAGENAELMERLAAKPAEDEREELADLIEDYFDGDCWRGVSSELSSVISAAGYSKGPRPITDEMVEAGVNAAWSKRTVGIGGQVVYGPSPEMYRIVRAALEAAEEARR